MNIRRTIVGLVIAMGLVTMAITITGCSNSSTPPAGAAASASASAINTGPPLTTPHPAMSAADTQSTVSKLESDPNLNSAQKQLMIQEAQHYGQQSAPGQ